MSLKHFHIIFVILAILCDGGFWLWTRLMPEQAKQAGAGNLGPFAGWIALALIAYGIWYVVKKCKTIII